MRRNRLLTFYWLYMIVYQKLKSKLLLYFFNELRHNKRKSSKGGIKLHIKSYNDERFKKLVVESIQSAFTQKDIGTELRFHNHVRTKRWDICFDEIDRLLEKEKHIETFHIDRTIWECIMIYFKDTRHATFIIKKERLKALKKVKTSHYVKLMARKNSMYDDKIEGSQRSIDWCDNLETVPSSEQLNELERKIYKEYSGKVDEISLVVFSTFDKMITSVSHIIPSSNLDTVYETSWNKYIIGEYNDDEELFTRADEAEVVEEHEINPPLTLKKIK